MYYGDNDTWYDEIKLPILDDNHIINNDYHELKNLDDIYDNYIEIKNENINSFVIEYTCLQRCINKCKNICTYEKFVIIFIYCIFIFFIILIVFIYNFYDFENLFNTCIQHENTPVNGLVIYNNNSLVLFQYEFIYNKYYTFNITCDIKVNSSLFVIGYEKQLYLSDTKDECSLTKYQCIKHNIDSFFKFLISILMSIIILVIILPIIVYIAQFLENIL